MTHLHYRQLDAVNDADVQDLQRVLDLAPTYHTIIEGQPAGPNAAHADLLEVPPGRTLADKFVYLIERDGDAIGCIDLFRGYPEPQVAFIGLLLFVESAQGQGYGTAALRWIESHTAAWHCTHLRIAVIDTNHKALAFWQRHGFTELSRKNTGRYTGVSIVMERPLA